jgi:hypothetical protein
MKHLTAFIVELMTMFIRVTKEENLLYVGQGEGKTIEPRTVSFGTIQDTLIFSIFY